MKHLTVFRIVPIACAALLQGCFGGGAPSEPTPNISQTYSKQGSYEVCSYTSNLSDAGYQSAIVTYPCDMRDGPYASTTLMGGFTNTKEQMSWLSEHLTSHGFVVITMTPTNRYSTPPTWATAHKAGFAKLSTENARANSPIEGALDLDKRAITGFSMGGGGALLATDDLNGENAVTVALAPYLGSVEPNFSNITVPSLFLGSENDELAYYVEDFYARLPATTTRALAMYTGASHFDWYLSNSSAQEQQIKFRTLVTAYLELKLNGNSAAESYFNGAEHEEHVSENWFSAYDYPSVPVIAQ